MAKYEIAAEMNLKKIISKSREVAQALNEFADDLERIEGKYAEPTMEGARGDIPIQRTVPKMPKMPKTGHWVKKSQYGNDYCSECGYELLMYGKPKYCPNCGAKMESEVSE